MNSIFKEFKNLTVEKKTVSTTLRFKPRSFDCRSTERFSNSLNIEKNFSQ